MNARASAGIKKAAELKVRVTDLEGGGKAERKPIPISQLALLDQAREATTHWRSNGEGCGGTGEVVATKAG